MTDKQIIINGVDVSGCERLIINKTYGYVCNCEEDTHLISSCKNRPNCYFKQLKRKEQECEQEKTLKEMYLTYYKAKHDDIKGEFFRYKRVLTEIKYIAEENIRIADLEGLSGVYRRGLAEQILQKIREVEDES